jgi:cellobiose phosphorylase
MIAGPQAARPGEAKNSWLTGTAAWNFVALSQWILGIRPEYDGLRIDPCIPAEWQGFTVERAFRGSRYRIRVANPRHLSRGVTSLRVDGREVAGNLVAPAGEGLHEVEAVLGEGRRPAGGQE